MQFLFIIIALMLPLSVNADTARTLLDIFGSVGKSEVKAYQYGVLRLSGGYGQSEIYDVKPDSAFRNFEKAKGKGSWGEIDLGMIMMMHFGFAQIGMGNINTNFTSGGYQQAKISFDKYQYGLKFVLPVPYANPFIGAGFMSGHMTVKEETGTVAKEHSRLKGRYWHAGLDILFSPVVGLRLSYTNDTIKTRKYLSLGNTPIEFEEHLGQAGLLLYF